MNAKKLWHSKTFWLNVAALAVELIKVLADVKELPAIDPGMLAILNVLVRLKTSQAVTVK